MVNRRNFCFITVFHTFNTLKIWFTYQCPSSWLVVITMKKKLADTWKKNIGYWLVQIKGNKFATGQILKKPVESCEGADFSWLSSKVSRTVTKTANVTQVMFDFLINFRQLLDSCALKCIKWIATGHHILISQIDKARYWWNILPPPTLS